jgi:protein TonB
MTADKIDAFYFDYVARRGWRTWVWSVLAAGGMNLVLFLFMPHLMDPAPKRSSLDTLIRHVNVIRVARPETPVQRERVKPPPEPKQLKKPRTTVQQPVMPRLTLPFEINPRLPAAPTSLVLPPIDQWASLQTSGLPRAFAVGQLDGPLTVLTRIPPVYPLRARSRGIQGWVKVTFIVEETGEIRDIDIIAAEPEGVFEMSVRRCVAGWRFKPGTVGGMPVRARVETTIKFTLE